MPINVERLIVYDPEHRVEILRDITCQIKDKQITLLLGRTGAGKTTFLDALTGIAEISQGSIVYDQHPLWSGKRLNHSVQLSIGSVFQYPEQQLFARTVQGEFDYSLHPLKLTRSEVQERTYEALNDMGLSADLALESPLILSEGQKRRVALASTFATRPKWLFLDEPTAGLDSETIQRLIEYLGAWKQNAGGGIVIATHDIDTLLPVADEVIVMKQGRIIAKYTPEELCKDPHILVEAEIGIPTNIGLLKVLSDQGIEVSGYPLSPEQYARHIVQYCRVNHGNAHMKRADRRIFAPEEESALIHQAIAASSSDADRVEASLPVSDVEENFIYDLDPRSKWLFYVLISIGILFQNNWPGLAFGTLITLVSVMASRMSAQKVMVVIKSFALLIVFSFILSGIRFTDAPGLLHVGIVYFSLQSAVTTFLQLYKILLITILGLLLPFTTSQLKMKRGLEQSLSGLRRLKVPVDAFSLAASLILHFIPLIMKEVSRFSRITRARGKRHTKTGTVRFRDMPALIIPLILSVLQLGSDLSLAMEARGYIHTGIRRTTSYDLKMRKADIWVVTAGITAIGIFILLNLASG